jgi:Sulfotransferase domain
MFKNLFSRSKPVTVKSKNIIVVSGLPRSGTSMMMKMLAEGGLEIISDALRTPDEDNPNGYFELEPVKQLSDGNNQWLAGAGGKAVKIISSLLEYLPSQYHYKIVFMERDLQEVLASQQKMLKNRQETSGVEDAEMAGQFEKHLAAIKYWLARQANMEVLFVSYNRMLREPQAYCGRIAEFIGMPLDVEKMLSIPSPTLYRNRANNT